MCVLYDKKINSFFYSIREFAYFCKYNCENLTEKKMNDDDDQQISNNMKKSTTND